MRMDQSGTRGKDFYLYKPDPPFCLTQAKADWLRMGQSRIDHSSAEQIGYITIELFGAE